ncbi:MAG: PAS domain-containing sensor histidine kinase [Candidatus Methanofastidiosa archaeon]|nr:PAS domain-containing sensor histidine kinase [Candidatus Methanofastidiosa archaeon]
MEASKNTIKKNKNDIKYIDYLQNTEPYNPVYAYPNLSVNRDGIIVYADRNVSRILGYTKSELIGMEATNIYVNTIDREILLKELYTKGSIQDYSVTLKRKDGKVVHCQLEMSIFKDSYGKVLGHTGILKDIKFEKDLRLKIEKENQRLFHVLEQLPVYVCLYDKRRNIIYANKYLRNRFQKFKNKKCYQIFYGKNESCEKCPVMDVFTSNSPMIYEKTQIDGRTYQIYDYPFLDIDGDKYVLELGIDISDKLIAENNLRSANETLDIINKVLRHDILNDLTVALNYCDLIKTEDQTTKNIVMQTISKCVDLIEKTGELEKAFNKKINSNDVKLFDINVKIAELVKHYPEININTLGGCKILVDESITTVFDNIIRNAKMHGKANNINITLKKEGNNCEVWISDDGIGIPDEYKDKIFNEGFSQGPNRGSGLGLYISKKILERQGGNIKVIDNKPRGSIFILTFMSEDANEIC